ncbi:hypothetical protein PAECIP111893_04442 [Paenibacillus plantiphilus]|uniref:N-acetyltransferase domain-containing protein n=1 Tax=Paenibacillus plantiphilus TaxID=2905650 RepID=A0ABN8GYJ7_9BACL|nr:GNAT family N-acetyltransferase [Paenibacillus plantiphilus]CAH1218547.1 hypothetical protein PAECIP111893_04442 [Paenibacillus plantiphilus]
MLQFEQASSDDELFLYELYAETRREELSVLNWQEEQEQAFLRMQFDAQRRSYRFQYSELRQEIVMFEQRRAGQLTTAVTEHAVVLVDVTLLPDCRNQGIGTEIITGLQQHAAALGLNLRLHVLQHNRAKRLYDRMGFQVTGEQPPYLSMEWKLPDSQSYYAEGGE